MKRVLFVLVSSTIIAGALAGDKADSTIWVTDVRGEIDSGWVTGWPPEDYNVAHDVEPGMGDSDNVVDGLPVTGIAVAVSDFGSGMTFTRVGVFNSNLGLDSSGNTPDLASPITSANSPPMTSPPLYDYVAFDLKEAMIPAGSTRVHAVAQTPLGDSGLLNVAADSTSAHPGVATSGFSWDGYVTPAVMITFIDNGLNPGQDNSTTTSCKRIDRKPHGRLRASNPKQNIGSGDRLTLQIRAGDTLNLAFFGPKAGDELRLHYAIGPCTPLISIGPVLPTLADGDGDGSYLRLNATWPHGYGGRTFRFSALWGNVGCLDPGVGFTNCVTIVTQPDPPFGVCDDGTIESGWVVQIPSGSSDYFNNGFGATPASVNGVVGLSIAVLDFGTAVPAYPTAGVSNANFGVDPSGNTPDVANPLACVCPFTFPALTFATTSGQYIIHAVAIPGASLGTNVHAWLQFPPGDSGLLGCGADSSSGTNGCSFFSLDGYSSPATSFFVNWGIRITTN